MKNRKFLAPTLVQVGQTFIYDGKIFLVKEIIDRNGVTRFVTDNGVVDARSEVLLQVQDYVQPGEHIEIKEEESDEKIS